MTKIDIKMDKGPLSDQLKKNNCHTIEELTEFYKKFFNLTEKDNLQVKLFKRDL